MVLKIRKIKQSELSFLSEMLYQAIFVPPDEQPPPKDIVNHPDLAKYINNFDREGDYCLVAELDGKLLGAVWTRLFSEQERGYGFVDSQTPELSMAVLEGFRGIGIGTKLLSRILDRLQELGYKKVSLSVDKSNYAYYLYKLFGFEDYSSSETSVTMLEYIN